MGGSLQPQVTPYDEQFMQQVMAFMEEQMDNTDITIDDFANKLMLSRTVFCRKIKIHCWADSGEFHVKCASNEPPS